MKEYELSFQKNIRDIGGYVGFRGRKIKEGRLIRGGLLSHLNDEDKDILLSLNITDIIDFRSSREFEKRPDFHMDNVIYHNVPVMEEGTKKEYENRIDGNLLWFIDEKDTGYTHMQNSYRDFVRTEQGRNAFKKFFQLLLSKNDGVFYYHCSQGKDRSGFASYLLEIALGVEEKTAIEDYLLTNKAMLIRTEFLINQIKDKPYYNEKYRESVYDVFSAKIDYLNCSLEEINKVSSSVIDYIKDVLEVDIEKLRKIYLEK